MQYRKLTQAEKDALQNIDQLRGFVAGKIDSNMPIFTDQLTYLAAQLEAIKARLEFDAGD